MSLIRINSMQSYIKQKYSSITFCDKNHPRYLLCETCTIHKIYNESETYLEPFMICNKKEEIHISARCRSTWFSLQLQVSLRSCQENRTTVNFCDSDAVIALTNCAFKPSGGWTKSKFTLCQTRINISK